MLTLCLESDACDAVTGWQSTLPEAISIVISLHKAKPDVGIFRLVTDPNPTRSGLHQARL